MPARAYAWSMSYARIGLVLLTVALSTGCYASTSDVGETEAELECAFGTWPMVESESGGVLTLALNYPRVSPDYEWHLYLASFSVEDGPELRGALERGEGLLSRGGGDPVLVIGRELGEETWRFLSADEAVATCPTLPAD